MLLIDTIAMALVLYYSRKNDQLRDGEPEVGLFRMRMPEAPKPKSTFRSRMPRG